MTIEKILFSLILSELENKPVQEDVKNALSSIVCSGLFGLCQRHDITCIIASALSKIGITDNGKTSADFKSQLRMAVFRQERMNYEFQIICEKFENAGIEYMPLKGLVIRKLYPKPWMRTSCDMDILIHPEDSEKAISVLCSEGFVQRKESTTHDYVLTTPGGENLELHYVLGSDGVFPEADRVLKSVWDYAKKTENSCRYTMTDEMFMFYHVLHMAKHFARGGCGIRPFIDLWLLKSALKCDETKLTQMFQKAGIEKFYTSVLKLSDVWFGEDMHTKISIQLQSFVITGGVYGTGVNAAKIKAANGERKIQSFFHLMFLPRGNLEVVYPELKNHPGMLPYYQVKRWFRVFNKNKRNKIHTITKTRNAVSFDEAISDLIKELGLFQ